MKFYKLNTPGGEHPGKNRTSPAPHIPFSVLIC